MSQMSDVVAGSVAAEKIFKYINYPSSINAVENNSDESKKCIGTENKGLIEFKDVWFRYPTRKEGFVLKGLNLII